jgi:hypothetical protein
VHAKVSGSAGLLDSALRRQEIVTVREERIAGVVAARDDLASIVDQIRRTQVYERFQRIVIRDQCVHINRFAPARPERRRDRPIDTDKRVHSDLQPAVRR